MKMKFIGAHSGVTGSCTLLFESRTNTSFLVDCGGFIGGNDAEWKNAQRFPFDPVELKFVLLTHAHFDHCGLLPKLYKEGFVGQVYCTRATAKLARIILLDAQKHSRLYDRDDVNRISFKYVDDDPRFGWGKPISLVDGLRVNFFRSSHIVGATSIQVNWGVTPDSRGKSIHFSGDIGPNFDENCYLPLMKSNQKPFPSTDYLVVESTYGGRNREIDYSSSSIRRQKLKEHIEDVVFKNNGKLLLPSFSMHRAQELLADLNYVVEHMLDKDLADTFFAGKEQKSARLKIAFDSKMLSQVSKVYANELLARNQRSGKLLYANERLFEEFSDIADVLQSGYKRFTNINGFIKFVQHEETKKKYDTQKLKEMLDRRIAESNIIVASGGMCETGPIIDYLKDIGDNVNNAIVFTGFLSEGSRGLRILNGEEPAIKAKIFNMSSYYSGHADEAGVLKYIFDLNGYAQDPKMMTKIIINHGNHQSKLAMADAINARKSQANKPERLVGDVFPLNGEKLWLDLDEGQFIEEEVRFDRSQIVKLDEKVTRLEEKINLILDRLTG